MARQNTAGPIVLGLLDHQDSSGYDLKKKIGLMISRFWNVGYGQLYPTLKKLEGDGCIEGRTEPSAKGPDRTAYFITDRGRQSRNAWLELPPEREAVRYEILLKLFFGSRIDAERNVEMVEDLMYPLRRVRGPVPQAGHPSDLWQNRYSNPTVTDLLGPYRAP